MQTKKADLAARCARLELENEPLTLALHDIVKDNVTWFGRGVFRLGISRPNGAHGGIVIVSCEGTISAHYWETWSREMHAHFTAVLTGKGDDYNREILTRRDLIETAGKFVRQMQAA